MTKVYEKNGRNMSIVIIYDSGSYGSIASEVQCLYFWDIVSQIKIEKLWQDKVVC